MKKCLVPLMLALSMSASAQTAKIKIDVDRTIGEIDPKIYGVFMEPIHFSGKRMGLPDTASFNTLYGNLYDPASPLADENGFRKDYIEAMKELKVTNMRWPGGNFVMGYNWKDGIGPKTRRPRRINLAWGGIDNNHVGTDEWIALNQSMGSENIVCVNLGLAGIRTRGLGGILQLQKGTFYSDLRVRERASRNRTASGSGISATRWTARPGNWVTKTRRITSRSPGKPPRPCGPSITRSVSSLPDRRTTRAPASGSTGTGKCWTGLGT